MTRNSLARKVLVTNFYVFSAVFAAVMLALLVKIYSDIQRSVKTENELNLRKSVAGCANHFKRSDFIELQRFAAAFVPPRSRDEVLIFLGPDEQVIAASNFDFLQKNRSVVSGYARAGVVDRTLDGYLVSTAKIAENSSVFGYVIYATRIKIAGAFFGQAAVAMLVLAVLFFAAVWGERFVLRRLTEPINDLVRVFKEQKLRDLPPVSSDLSEIAELKTAYNSWVAELDGYQRRLQEKTRSEAQLQIASQVAHDIRSPLAALDSALRDVSQLPEDRRLVVRSAVARIRDIANNLLDKNRQVDASAQPGAADPASSEPASIQLLSSLLDPLITEKRMQFRSRIGVEIEGRIDAASYGLFGKIQPNEFKRLVSNLVNNALEALGDMGRVTVRLFEKDERLRLEVRDTGRGIPPEILAKLGHRGQTYGKPDGSGLGLYHARTTLESWGGSLELRSEVGRGTTVVLSLPKARPPEWFVSVLEFDVRRPVVVLDDDSSIHQIWQGRFDSACPAGEALKIQHFSTPVELRDWVKSDAARARGAVYLMDCELLGHADTGLTLISELGLGERSILVTSRFEEKAILEECLRLKARLIPKGLAGFVPIRVRPATGAGARLDAVLIDDDALVRMNWSTAAKRAGKFLKVYADAASFLADLDVGATPTDTPIYIDSNLADGVKGEEVALEIGRRGFAQIRLATGHDPASFPSLPHIREIVGKTPPWDAA